MQLIWTLVLSTWIFSSIGVGFLGFLKPKWSPALSLLVSWYLGCAVVATSIFGLGLVIGSNAYWLMWAWAGVAVWQTRNWWQLLEKTWRVVKHQPLVSGFAGFGAISLASTLIFSWISGENGITIQSGQLHDSAWHIALIHQLSQQLPPIHPAASGQLLSNYHYFYDLLLAALHVAFGVDVTTAYFQIWPLLLSFGLAAAVALVTTRLASTKSALWAVFLTFFGGSLAFLIPMFLPGRPWSESSFWVSQTFAMMVNPQMIYSLGLSVVVLDVLGMSQGVLKKTTQFFRYQALLIFLIASSFGFKSYGWLVLSWAYGGFLLWLLAKKEFKKVLGLGLSLVAISIPYVGLLTGFKSSTFFWYPLWYMTSMIEAQDRVYYPIWRLQEDFYRADGNWLRVIDIRTRELIIFLLGNLGTRALFGLGLLSAWWSKKFLPKSWGLWIWTTGFAAIFPLLFLQTGAVWNSIQFWYYVLIFTNILAAMWLGQVTQKLSKQKLILVVLVVSVAAANFPTYYITQLDKLSKFETLPKAEVELVQSIPAGSKVLICPNDSVWYQTSSMAAVSGARPLIANTAQLYLIGEDPKPLEDQILALEKSDPSATSTFLSGNGIQYIWCNRESWSQLLPESEYEKTGQIGVWHLWARKS